MEKLNLDYQRYKGLVSKIVRDISINDWRPDYIVGLTRGGLLPATMLSHYFDVPMHTLRISLRDHEDSESNLWMSEEALGHYYHEAHDFPSDMDRSVIDEKYRKNILIVDDINDSGATINWIIQDWKSSCFPNDKGWDSVWGNNVRVAVLVENTASKCQIQTSYVGMSINKSDQNVWVEFPYENWWE